MATPCSESCTRNVVRSVPAGRAACPEDRRFISNSFAAVARRASRSTPPESSEEHRAGEDGYSMCIERFRAQCWQSDGIAAGPHAPIKALVARLFVQSYEPFWRPSFGGNLLKFMALPTGFEPVY